MSVPIPIKVFVSYSRKDKDYKEELLEFLAPMRRNDTIQIWNDKDILPGEQWEDELLERLTTADIVIFLVSPSLLNSDYIHRVEIKGAMERHKKGELVIIPILIRNSDFAESDFKTFQGLPSDLKPVSTWEDRDSAWLNITKGLKRVIESIQKKKERNTTTTSVGNNPSGETMPDDSTVFDKARTAIVNTKMKDGIELLMNYTKINHKDRYNSLLLLSSQFNALKKDRELKVRRDDDIDISINRLKNSLFSIIDNLEKETGE